MPVLCLWGVMGELKCCPRWSNWVLEFEIKMSQSGFLSIRLGSLLELVCHGCSTTARANEEKNIWSTTLRGEWPWERDLSLILWHQYAAHGLEIEAFQGQKSHFNIFLLNSSELCFRDRHIILTKCTDFSWQRTKSCEFTFTCMALQF